MEEYVAEMITRINWAIENQINYKGRGEANVKQYRKREKGYDKEERERCW